MTPWFFCVQAFRIPFIPQILMDARSLLSSMTLDRMDARQKSAGMTDGVLSLYVAFLMLSNFFLHSCPSLVGWPLATKHMVLAGDARPSVPDMGCISYVETYVTEVMEPTVAEPQGVTVRPS